MTKMEILDRLARDRRVEVFVLNTAHAAAMSPDLKDLVQMVYLYLADFPEDKLLDLYDCNQLDFFVARIIVNQFRSSNSKYHRTIRRPAARAMDLAQVADLIPDK